ncbi:MAG: prepilin-type N-terminal cleavage/methylation domain-containing protein [Xanthomonadales bacterium]|nr:prepilin-type N-terminal cleavage/methylation domain-containing protein [Xanthomonadales bacterium]
MKSLQIDHPQGSAPGFTLLEVMISVLIISIGLAALANLQGKLTNYSTVAKQRTIAMNVAEQQIETMHSFFTMGDTGAAACSVLQVGFDDLESCESANTVTVGNLQLDVTWTITGYTQNADGSTEPYSSNSGRVRPDLKMVTVHVGWTDGEGASHNFELQDVIDATSIFNTGRIMARVDSNLPPRTTFNPQNFPGVVELAIGNDKLKGATTPEPKIVNQGVNVITSFDVITYLQSQNDAYLQRREEFKVVNCICTLNSGLGTGREPTVWDGKEYVLGELVSKRTGSVSADEAGQPAACEMCCRDHHDSSSAEDSYDPFRPAFSGDAGSFNFYGDHAHYGLVNGIKELAVEGDEYLEACRYIRKDGFFRLTTDMALENLDVVSASFPSNFNSSYSSSVVNFVGSFMNGVDAETYPGVVPDGSYSSSAPGMFFGNAGVTKQAMSRGIYVDYLTDELLAKIKCLQAGGSGPFEDHCNTLKDPPWLEILPFFDIDTTSLANWSKGSSAITVTNSPISDITSNSFSRGAVSLSQNHFSVATDVTADIEVSNTGLTDTNPIDPDDETEESEDYPVLVDIGGTPPAAGILVLGDINAGSNQINVETVRVTQNPPAVNCEIVSIVDGNSTQKAYVCDLALSGGAASGTVTVKDYNALKVTGNSVTVLNRKVCTDNAAYVSLQVFDDGVMADPDLGIPGEVTVMTFSGLSEDTTINLTIVKQSSSCP